MRNLMSDSRHPYPYASDYVRILAGYGDHGSKLSRADASKIRQGISKAIGMDDAEMAAKLADYYKANEEGLTALAVESVVAAAESRKAARGD
jgi:hypothetical protein